MCPLDQGHCQRLVDQLFQKCIFLTSRDDGPLGGAFFDLKILCDSGKHIIYASSAILHTAGNELATAVRLIEVRKFAKNLM